ncbi:MAG: hypothetical protein KatS3mg109_2166 [Pirellulaceae bacterium]|nr:MAG: hypothetical protein KatS3mg109_2166 [Pirellulaceae bacterium]
MVENLSYQQLQDSVAGTAAAFRCVTEYEPAGGPEAPIFPPTYEGGRYALVGYQKLRPANAEEADIQVAERVLVDSVQSQANRMELALLRAWEDGLIPLPVITVDFAGHGLPKVLRITSLEAPHRIADALLRDSLYNGRKFRESDIGKRLDAVDLRNATPLFEVCPTALLFGMWDSTGPRGGLGAKFQRAIVSEIVGIDVQLGKKTASRIDPAEILLQAGPLYRTEDGGWTLDESKAMRDKGKPAKLGKDGRPSEANLGNVTPTIADGGVYVKRIVQTTVLSLAALRRLRFPIDGQFDAQRDTAARTALAALGLCAATLARQDGDLRSRCQIFPKAPFVWELLDQPGQEPQQFALAPDAAVELYKQAVDTAKKAGLPWLEQEVVLTPSEELVALVKKSQELAASVTGGEES